MRALHNLGDSIRYFRDLAEADASFAYPIEHLGAGLGGTVQHLAGHEALVARRPGGQLDVVVFRRGMGCAAWVQDQTFAADELLSAIAAAALGAARGRCARCHGVP